MAVVLCEGMHSLSVFFLTLCLGVRLPYVRGEARMAALGVACGGPSPLATMLSDRY